MCRSIGRKDIYWYLVVSLPYKFDGVACCNDEMHIYVCPGPGLPAFWGPHGRWAYPAALSAWGVSGRSHHPQHHDPLHQLYQVMTTRTLLSVFSVTLLLAGSITRFTAWFSFLVHPALPLRALDSIAEGESTEVAGYVEEVLQTLNDLIEYFKQPDSELEHEEKQCLLRSLIKRQDLFKEEVRVGNVEPSTSD